MNGEIRDRESRVISETGEMLGVMPPREAMRLAEAAILERLRTEGGGMPALSASVGGAGLPLTPKTKPKTLSEAAALAREAFGV